MGVIALVSEWTIFATSEELAHDSLVLAGVRCGDSHTSLIIHCKRLRSLRIGLGRLASNLVDHVPLALRRLTKLHRRGRHDLLRTGSIDEFRT